jgi:hypothetical protein
VFCITTETLTEVVVGVKVDINGVSDMLIEVTTVTLKLGTVATVRVVVFVGVGRAKQPQAVDMREHAKGKGAPAQLPACGVVDFVVVDVVDFAVVNVVVGFLIGGGGGGGNGRCRLRFLALTVCAQTLTTVVLQVLSVSHSVEVG